MDFQDFSSGLVKTAFQCRRCEFDHYSGAKISHATWPKKENQSIREATREAV